MSLRPVLDIGSTNILQEVGIAAPGTVSLFNPLESDAVNFIFMDSLPWSGTV